jgi:high-affinity iron transporter
MIGAFYGLGKDIFSKTEDLWEGIFAILAAVIITLMGAALLRVSKLQEKWRVKIAKAIESKDSRARATLGRRFAAWCERYAMFILPFITVLREGLEAVIFIGGVGIGMPASSFPLAVFTGLLAGIAIGFLIYKGGNQASLQIFLVVSTCFLYLVAAGLFSKGAWYFQNRAWNLIVGRDASEVGSGPGSYNIRQSVWHVNCCNPQINGGGGWGIFNAIFGWQNSATYGSAISYNMYWIIVILTFLAMRYNETHGHWPLMKSKMTAGPTPAAESDSAERTPSEPPSLSVVQSGSNVEKSAFKEKVDTAEETSITRIHEVGE